MVTNGIVLKASIDWGPASQSSMKRHDPYPENGWDPARHGAEQRDPLTL